MSQIYPAGSLTYARGGLIVLSLWLLWGDFAFYFFDSIFMRFIPIYLKELEASNTLIGVRSGIFPGRSDFTLGAVHRGGGMGNWFVGRLGGLAVYSRALDREEMLSLGRMPLCARQGINPTAS